jgi:hypothetical protein
MPGKPEGAPGQEVAAKDAGQILKTLQRSDDILFTEDRMNETDEDDDDKSKKEPCTHID